MSRSDDLFVAAPADRVTEGNRVEHLPDDDESVRRIWQTIEEAKVCVWMTMYILKPDRVGLRTLDLLTGAARRGCEVRLIYDHWGSFGLRGKHTAALHEAGGHIAIFNRLWPPWKKQGRLTIRNHRKITIVDGEVAFCGGQNLSEAFAGRDLGEFRFDDSMTRVAGPCVRCLADIFLGTWKEITGEDREAPPEPAPDPDGVRVAVVETDPRREETSLLNIVSRAIGAADTRCFLISPYFIPAAWLKEALLAAARRGVDVRVLTAGDSDRTLAREAGRSHYEDLLREGVCVFELFGRMLHAKTLAIDESFGHVGSYNFDLWTSKHVLDAAVLVEDPAHARAVREEFEQLQHEADEISLDAWQQRGFFTRLKQGFSYWLAKLL